VFTESQYQTGVLGGSSLARSPSQRNTYSVHVFGRCDVSLLPCTPSCWSSGGPAPTQDQGHTCAHKVCVTSIICAAHLLV
jgi:hypothetical protein